MAAARERENVGLPLEAAMLLSAAPAGMFWSTTGDNGRLERIKRLLDDNSISVVDDERTKQSRLVLRRYAHERFASENETMTQADLPPMTKSAFREWISVVSCRDLKPTRRGPFTEVRCAS